MGNPDHAMKLDQIVSKDPDIVSGALVFRDTRVPVQTLIDYLKSGETLDRFLDGFPTVRREQAEAYLEGTLGEAAIRVAESGAAAEVNGRPSGG